MSATDVELLEVGGSGVLFGQVFVDLDGTGTVTQADSPFVDVEVRLLRGALGQVAVSTWTDSLGGFVLTRIPLGTYTVGLAPSSLGDSLTAAGVTDPVTIQSGDSVRLDLTAGFEELSLEDALAAPVGRRIFTTGIALNSRPNFGDGQVHFGGDSLTLRALDVERGNLAPGDSVRLLGRVVVDQGRPALRTVRFFVLVPRAKTVTPVEATTAQAATADGARIDAALARVRRAEITDTSTTPQGHFRFWADDGTDSVEVWIRDFLVPSINTSVFRPDTTVRIRELTGLLSPLDEGAGSIRWRIMPRAGADIVLETKLADIVVTTSFDTTQASLGDTVEIRTVAQNLGPHLATATSLSDTIPTGVTLLSATATRGSYDDGTGVWDIGSLAAGVADTLWISVEVTLVGPGTITNIAESLGLVLEVDPVGSNNAASADLTVN